MMASKDELQTTLKERYGINKNISQVLSQAECQRLLALLDSDPTAVKLIESFVDKNLDLGNRNRLFGQQREQAKKRLDKAQAEYEALQASIQEIEGSNQALSQHKLQLETQKLKLEQEAAALQMQVDGLKARSQKLEDQVKTLNSDNQELVTVNDELKKDNKRLKNLLDAIRLKFSQEMRQVLKTEDSEIRKAIVKLYKSILG